MRLPTYFILKKWFFDKPRTSSFAKERKKLNYEKS